MRMRLGDGIFACPRTPECLVILTKDAHCVPGSLTFADIEGRRGATREEFSADEVLTHPQEALKVPINILSGTNHTEASSVKFLSFGRGYTTTEDIRRPTPPVCYKETLSEPDEINSRQSDSPKSVVKSWPDR